MSESDLAAMAQFGKTVEELTEDEFVALLKMPGAAQFGDPVRNASRELPREPART